MLTLILDLMRAHRQELEHRIVARVTESIPRYALGGGVEVRRSVELLLDDVLRYFELHDERPVVERLVDISRRRIAQGFLISEYLRAILSVFPAVRGLVREAGHADEPEYARGFDEFERATYGLAATAADVFADHLLQQMEAKNQELNRLNQKLIVQERALSTHAERVSKTLESVNEFNRRVIESLTAGLVVIDARTRRVSLYTTRMEEILGLPADQVLGRDVSEAFAALAGLDSEAIVATVQAHGRLPLTKIHLTRPDGRRLAILVRAQRLFDSAGEPEGTVVVVDDVSERELLLDSFSRYVSRDLVQRLLARGGPLELSAEQRSCTILFADIRGYTGLAEQLEPQRLHALLNQYFRVLIETITEHGGFIDKFIGDNVMAIFSGGPADEHAVAGAAAARAIIQRIGALNRDRERDGVAPIAVGIGVNTGEVLLGNIGSEDRMDFTAIGDPVNVAARLQSLATPGQVLLGEQTARLVAPRLAAVDLGPRPVKGRRSPVRMFELAVPGEPAAVGEAG